MGEFWRGGQRGWAHDPGLACGSFHTYDSFRVGGPSDCPRKVHILLPPRYTEAGMERFSVVYIHDGHRVFFHEDGVGDCVPFLRVPEVLGTLSRFLRPFMCVAIFPLTRTREFVPEEEEGAVRMYARYLAYDVKRWVDANYRTRTSGADTALLGVGLGAQAALLCGILHPDRFGIVLALAPSLPADRNALTRNIIRLDTHHVLLDRARRPHFFLTWNVDEEGDHNGGTCGKRVMETLRGTFALKPEELGGGPVGGDAGKTPAERLPTHVALALRWAFPSDDCVVGGSMVHLSVDWRWGPQQS